MVRRTRPGNFYDYLCVCLLSCIASFLLSSCGGGGSSTPPPPPSNPLPAIASISPTSLTAGAAATTITITGSGFILGSTAQWNSSARTTTFVSSTQLQIALTVADLASAGTEQITVMNPAPGGGVSGAATLTIDNPSPAITTISPATVLAGSGDTLLDITGSGFVSSAVITWNGTSLTTSFVSSTEVKAMVPASDLTGSSVSQVAVTNPGGWPTE
jgi:hypothetical protein